MGGVGASKRIQRDLTFPYFDEPLSAYCIRIGRAQLRKRVRALMRHCRLARRYAPSLEDPTISHDAPDLMGAAFNSAWVVVRPQQLEPHSAQEKQLRLDLARCITDLVANGVTEPDELRRQAIEQMLLAPRSETA